MSAELPHLEISTPTRTHVPELELFAINQKPKSSDHRDLRLYRYGVSSLYQWWSKRDGSVFEDPCDEPFIITARDQGPGPGEAVADDIAREAIAWLDSGPNIGAVGEGFIRHLSSEILAAKDQEPVAWRYTLHMELGQTRTMLSPVWRSPFGAPGKDHSEEYAVTCEPLYAATPTREGGMKLTNKMGDLLRLLVSFPGGKTCYEDYPDSVLAPYWDDNPSGGDTFNQAIDAGLIEATVDSDTDTGFAAITEAGRLALQGAEHDQ